MEFLEVPLLRGQLVQLEPLSMDHEAALVDAVSEDDLYKVWYTRVPSPEDMGDEIARRLDQHARGEVVPWAIRRIADDRPIGMTTYLNLRQDNRRLEIGSTWIASSAQRTGINTEAKLLQLTRAFEDLHCIAVEFRTHWHNRRSRRAIESLGAKQDGVLRNHDLWRDGTVRDVVVFSVIEGEWPTVRLALTRRLSY